MAVISVDLVLYYWIQMHPYLIDLAKDIVTKNRQHVTFVLYGRKVIAIGQNNRYKTHPLTKRFRYPLPHIHSELDAIIKAERRRGQVIGCLIFNVRIDRQGRVRNSRPCKACKEMLEWYGVGTVYYSTDDSNQFVRLLANDVCKEWTL